MKTWLEISILIDCKNIEAVSERLQAQGYESFWTNEPFEVLKTVDGYAWQETRQLKQALKVYKELPASSSGSQDILEAETQRIRRFLGDRVHQVTGRIAPEVDWEAHWRQTRSPISVSDHIIIYPFQHNDPIPEEVTAIFIEPGMAFGTGAHATTRQALSMLKTFLRPADAVLDLGAGSGILSVMAAMLGAAIVVAVDHNPDASTEISKNAALNQVRNIEIVIGDAGEAILPEKKYDLILLNIGSEMAIDLLPVCLKYLKPDGCVIVSGIVNWRRDDVLKKYQDNGFRILKVMEDETEWLTFLARKANRQSMDSREVFNVSND